MRPVRHGLCNPALALLRCMFLFIAASVLTAGCGSNKENEKGNDNGTAEWFYQSFDDRSKAAYDAFRTASENPFDPEPVVITDAGGESLEVPVTDLDTVYQGFLYDHPEFFWLSASYHYRSCGSGNAGELADAVSVIPIPESRQELDRQAAEFEKAVDRILHETAADMGDRDRARILYDVLTGETEYAQEALYDSARQKEHTAYGAIAEKKAVCDGIALAYKLLLDRCGIRCIVIPGTSEGAAHVWNTVYWDGGWHEADPTWDTISDDTGGGQYFDLTTEEMNKDHKREEGGIALLIPTAR